MLTKRCSHKQGGLTDYTQKVADTKVFIDTLPTNPQQNSCI